MKKYEIIITIDNSNTPYIPSKWIYGLDLWKKHIAPTLSDIGFIHLGDAMVLGDDNMMAEFILINHIPSEFYDTYNNPKIIIKEK